MNKYAGKKMTKSFIEFDGNNFSEYQTKITSRLHALNFSKFIKADSELSLIELTLRQKCNDANVLEKCMAVNPGTKDIILDVVKILP